MYMYLELFHFKPNKYYSEIAQNYTPAHMYVHIKNSFIIEINISKTMKVFWRQCIYYRVVSSGFFSQCGRVYTYNMCGRV